jgi:uncharacterized protein YdcH (DUF465 family)
MAYPGEEENKEYMDYAIEEQSNGRKPLPKDEWRKMKTSGLKSIDRIVSALSEGGDA